MHRLNMSKITYLEIFQSFLFLELLWLALWLVGFKHLASRIFSASLFLLIFLLCLYIKVLSFFEPFFWTSFQLQHWLYLTSRWLCKAWCLGCLSEAVSKIFFVTFFFVSCFLFFWLLSFLIDFLVLFTSILFLALVATFLNSG